MSEAVKALEGSVPKRCRVKHCNRDQCKLGLRDLPSNRIIVDMDCKALGIPGDQTRCDYLYVGDKHKSQAMVVPIELKGGRVSSASEVVAQLQKGANQACAWLPSNLRLEFIPVLAHGGSIHRKTLKSLRSLTVRFRGESKQVALLRCGGQLRTALG